MRTFHGYIVENDSIICEGDFFKFGEMSDKTGCYYKVGHENEEWYTRQIITIDGRKVNLFFEEGV